MTSNRILLALPSEIQAKVLAACHPIEFRAGDAIYRTGEPIKDVYFVDRGLVCLRKSMEDGRSVEIAAIGGEGLVGVLSLVGSGPALADYLVQVPVKARRIGLTMLRTEMSLHIPLRSLITRFFTLLAGQFAQISACNRLHSLEQRCCSWLLIARDNVSSDKFELTHEFMASLLGVHGPSVSATADGLQHRGVIHCSHAHITVLDRAALESAACECYRVWRRQIDDAFP